MKNIIAKEWINYKKDLEDSIQKAIAADPKDKDVMELMLELLKTSKLKNRK